MSDSFQNDSKAPKHPINPRNPIIVKIEGGNSFYMSSSDWSNTDSNKNRGGNNLYMSIFSMSKK